MAPPSDKPKKVPPAPEQVRARVLMSNRHMCCICHAMPAMIHYIDGDPSNHAQANLAALCHHHYRKANLPEDDPEHISPHEIKRAKSSWQKECLSSLLGLRGKG